MAQQDKQQSSLSILTTQQSRSSLAGLLRMTFPNIDHMMLREQTGISRVLKEKDLQFVIVENGISDSDLSQLKSYIDKEHGNVPIILLIDADEAKNSTVAKYLTIGITAVLATPVSQEKIMNCLEISRQIKQKGSFERLKIASFLRLSTQRDGDTNVKDLAFSGEIYKYAKELFDMTQSQRLRTVSNVIIGRKLK